MHENIVNVVFAVRKEPTDLNSVSASFIFFFLSSYSFYLFIFFETKFSTFLGGGIFYFIFLLYFTLQYCIGFAIHWYESAIWVPNPEPPSHHPPHIISLGHPSAPAPSILYPVSNLDWWFISYMTVYMFQCHSPTSSHPLPLPQSPKDCSIHLRLFCCLA